MMDALTYYRAELKKSRVAIDYLKGRGLSGEIAARYGMGFAPDGWQNLEAVFPDYATAPPQGHGPRDRFGAPSGREATEKKSRRYDRFRNRVMFPILDARGNVIGFGGRVIGEGEPKYLNSPETPLFEKGRELYGLYQARRAIRDANQVLVVEGYMDVVALAQHGVENAVATLGTATTPMHLQKLLRLADNVVFCFDGDSAGRKAAWRALEVSLPVLSDGKAVSFLFLPPEDDPDTYIRREGKDAFLKAVAEAKPLSQFLFAELASKVDMATEEGRARFLAQAKPLVAQIEAPALAAMLRRRLAELARLAPEEMEVLLPSKAQPRRAMSPAPARGVRRKIPAEGLLLLAHPCSGRTWRKRSPMTWRWEILPESATLRAVGAYFREDPSRTLGQASAYFEGSEHQAALEESLADPLLDQADSPDLDLEAEVLGLVEKLRGDQLARRRTELAQLLAAGTATPEQTAEYNRLFASLQTAKSGNPTPEARSKI